MPEPKFIDDAPKEPQFIDDAPKGKAIAWDSKSSDDDIIKALGYDPAVIKKSKFYSKNMFSRLTTDPGSPISKATSGPLFAGLKGVANIGVGLAQIKTRLNPLFNESDKAIVDLTKKFMDLEYERSHTQFLGEKAEGPAKAVLGGSELLGEMAATPVGGPGLRGAKIVSAQGAKQLGKIAAAGGLNAMIQPVDVEPGGSFLEKKAMQGATGALTAPAMALGINLGGKTYEGAKRLFTKGEDFAPEAVVNLFKGKVKGRASDVIQQDLSERYTAARKEAGAAFQALRADAGNTPVLVPNYASELDRLLDTAKASRAGADKALVTELAALKKALSNPKADTSFGGTMDIGSRLNEIYGDAISGEKPNRALAASVKKLKDALQADLDTAGKQYGQRYQDAKKLWQEKVVPWEDPEQGGKLLRSFIKSPTPDAAMDALLKAKSEDKLNVFISKLSKDKGIPALQAGLVESVYKQSLDDAGNVLPDKFLGALKQRQDAYGLAFTGEAKWRMDGLSNLLKDSRFVAKALTGEWIRSIPMGRVLPGSAFPTPGAGSILQKVFTTPGVSKLLVQAQGAKPNSPQMEKIIDSIYANLTKAGALSAGEEKTKEPE